MTLDLSLTVYRHVYRVITRMGSLVVQEVSESFAVARRVSSASRSAYAD